MQSPLHHVGETASNATRDCLQSVEPVSLRTYTPTLAVIAKSAGVFHYTPEGKRLFDFTSGVLVANLGHNPNRWLRRFAGYMGWPTDGFEAEGYLNAVPMTAYNAATPIELQASQRLITCVQKTLLGKRLQQTMWAASGSEAIQKALWAAMARDKTRPIILATRYGFHGKKGLANAVTGSEQDPERDPRVQFISFPREECQDVSLRNKPFDISPYKAELDALLHRFGAKIGCLITEPYLGGGGSYHPPKEYLQLLQRYCRENDWVFILDEVQANFGRTGSMFAFESYGLEPDMVVLGKGLGNGVPVAAVVGRKDLFASMTYGEASDTWSANPLNAASVLATLDEFESEDIMKNCHASSAVIEKGLVDLKVFPFVAHLRGEHRGMVWGVEMQDYAGKTAAEWANAFVLEAYRGEENGDGVHLLGPLAKKVVRISPPLVITPSESAKAMEILHVAAKRL